MKKLLAISSGLIFFALPALAFADQLTPLQMQIRQLSVVVASLEAEEAALGGQPIVCAALVSKPVVKINEPFFLAWGSVGAMNPGDDLTRSMWAQNDSQLISVDQPGTWKYSFKFYARSGETAKCSVSVVVGA